MIASACCGWSAIFTQRDLCARTGSANRRLFRRQGHYDAYRCRVCDGYYTLLSGTIFEGSRKRPAVLVLLLRGISKGDSTARLARELQLLRQTVHRLRQWLQTNVNGSAPTGVTDGQTFEVDEVYQNAGGKKYAPSPARRSATSAGQ
jgi:transposase-like protein